MKSQELVAWADAYIQAQELDNIETDHALWWAVQKFFDLDHENPEACWQAILTVLAREPSQKVLGVLSAGPLEDLLHHHGPQFIDRIEVEARDDPAFKELLCGVWQSSTDEIWARVQRARGMA
jgi:hypothetical protein